MSKFFRSKIPYVIGLAGIAGALLVLYAWQLPPFNSTVVSTDNAYVRGQVTLLSAQGAGTVTAVHVRDYQPVRQGDVLVEIDDRTAHEQLASAEAGLQTAKASLDSFSANRAAKVASLDLAKAQLLSAEAGLEKAKLDSTRTASLVTKGITSQSTGDQAHVALQQADAAVAQANANIGIAEQNVALVDAGRPSLEAAVASAEAAVSLARITLGNLKVVAPVDGRLGEVGVRVGQYVAAGTSLTSVTPDAAWVIANFKETQVGRMAVGQPARFTVDALVRQTFTGRVIHFAPAAGSEFSVIKADNATGNFTKVPQRISARIEIDPGQAAADGLRPGMSVVVTVDTSAAADATLAAADEPAEQISELR
ncbi:Multidrug resistance efflux pump [Kaistia soli DSM 19436]|uniref:Multidrug resistance efflux pump n=1 Tax=Kaistia soli DSM 19436 TaxID=1122133 RepID=A0A1M4ZKM6_9HYPH|nr:HlyD family secretion protein [Kaistia soli]SHF18372.1 Multidrug resistance efflux pump [Kaistia soli DSM 19436]